MAAHSDASLYPPSPSRTASSPSLLRGFTRNAARQLMSPLPKPSLNKPTSPGIAAMDSPSSPSSPSKIKTRGDRYIPERLPNGFSVSQFALSQADAPQLDRSPSVESYKRSLARSMFDSDMADVVSSSSTETSVVPSDSIAALSRSSNRLSYGSQSMSKLNSPKSPSKVLSFSPRVANGSTPNTHKVLASQVSSPRRKAMVRVISNIPERVLDAPGLLDDYYLNLLDWSSSNIVGVALGDSVYVWNVSNGESSHLCSLKEPHSYVASITFSGTGQYMAVGTHDQLVKIWDVESGKMIRTIHGHTGRVGSLSWNDQMLSSGARDGLINTHDVRIQESKIASFQGHTNEVCGLKWSPDGTQLASGGNDNSLQIWSMASTKPIYRFDQHLAAVKALSWCPWQRGLLASGGGSADRSIKFWSTSTGTCLNSVDTKSQVCSLQWSKHVKELVSSHGFSQNQLSIWKYPSIRKQADLTGHSSRILHTAMSPDGTTIVSAGADETLRFWRIFDVESSLPKLLTSHSEANLRKKMLR